LKQEFSRKAPDKNISPKNIGTIEDAPLLPLKNNLISSGLIPNTDVFPKNIITMDTPIKIEMDIWINPKTRFTKKTIFLIESFIRRCFANIF
jgi:hypothetical protein